MITDSEKIKKRRQNRPAAIEDEPLFMRDYNL
jgi:hypothetical protein